MDLRLSSNSSRLNQLILPLGTTCAACNFDIDKVTNFIISLKNYGDTLRVSAENSSVDF
jgi:hypothetical protein